MILCRTVQGTVEGLRSEASEGLGKVVPAHRKENVGTTSTVKKLLQNMVKGHRENKGAKENGF